MNERQFFNAVTDSKEDILYKFLNILNKNKISYCVLGGVALNAYCEPILTLDFDCVVSSSQLERLKNILKKEGFKFKSHPHTWELTSKNSDLRIQIQRNGRYQDFIDNAKELKVLGYKMKIAKKEDLLRGKIWAYKDKKRNVIKREKDLLDIKRLVKKYPSLKKQLPKEILKKIEKKEVD